MILREFSCTFAEAGDHFIQGLRNTAGANLTWHCREILAITSLYDIELLKEALSAGVNLRAYHKNHVLGLVAKASQRAVIVPSSSPFQRYLAPVDIHRDLGEYSGVASHE